MANYFDQFDAGVTQPGAGGNPFDQFDAAPAPMPPPAAPVEAAPSPAIASPLASHPAYERGRNLVRNALRPITSYPETYGAMNRAGVDQMSRGVEQITAGARSAIDPEDTTPAGEGPVNLIKGAGNVALGGLSYVASPIMAGLKTIVGNPVEATTGIPAAYPEFAASFAIPGIGMTKLNPTAVAAAPRMLKPGEEVALAAQRLSQTGAEVTVPKAVASDSMLTQRAAATVKNVPAAGDPIVKATEKSIGQLGTKADEIAAEFGGASVPSAGGTAKQSILDWIGPESKAKVKTAYDRVDSLVDPKVTTDLSATQAKVAEIMARRVNSGEASAGKAADLVSGAITRPGGLNYQGIKDLRTRVGEMLDNGILPEGWSQSELKQIYSALSDDLGSAVKAAGGTQAKSAWERANTYNRLVNERRESLAKVVGSSGDAPAEQVFDRISAMASSSSRADISRLAQARKTMEPAEWNEISSAVVSRLGRGPEGEFSAQRFVTAWGKLSDNGKELLFQSGGKSNLAQSLDDIATISGRWKDLQKFSNPSGTGQATIGAGLGAGLYADPLTTISIVVGARGLAYALARPATAAPVAQFARRYEIALSKPTPANVANLTVSTRNLANSLGESLGKTFSPDDFLRAVQGPGPAPVRAEDQQQD